MYSQRKKFTYFPAYFKFFPPIISVIFFSYTFLSSTIICCKCLKQRYNIIFDVIKNQWGKVYIQKCSLTVLDKCQVVLHADVTLIYTAEVTSETCKDNMISDSNTGSKMNPLKFNFKKGIDVGNKY